jgi:hypothetical protein
MTVERLLPGRPLPGLSNERPPIVVTKDGYHVGNKSVTRTQLARARGEYVYPTFVLDVEWENATDDERVRLLSLAERLDMDEQPSEERIVAPLPDGSPGERHAPEDGRDSGQAGAHG